MFPFYQEGEHFAWNVQVLDMTVEVNDAELAAALAVLSKERRTIILLSYLLGMAVSWSIGTRPNANLVNSMLDQAVRQLGEGKHPIIHSDRGGHYRWSGWIRRMEQAGLTRSMSRKGCSPDNLACEGFFGRLKNEMFYDRSWEGVSVPEFIRGIDDYMRWYNEDGIKLSLGALSPAAYGHSLGFTI